MIFFLIFQSDNLKRISTDWYVPEKKDGESTQSYKVFVDIPLLYCLFCEVQ